MNSMILFAQAAQEAAKPAAQQSGGMGMLVPMLLIFAIFYFINFEKFCVSKVLEYLSVFIGNCNFHFHFLQSFCLCFFISVFATAATSAGMFFSVAKLVIASFDTKGQTLY